MGFGTYASSVANRWLQLFNLQLKTLTRERREKDRLQELERSGHFLRRAFPLLDSFRMVEPGWIFERLARYQERFQDFQTPAGNAVGYSFANPWYTSPDAEVLYIFVREFRPGKIIEIGSGHSTKIIRQAVQDEGTSCRLVCVDPHPRDVVGQWADQVYHHPVKELQDTGLLDSLQPDDLLFIDSSHEVKTGNDVSYLYLHLLPRLQPGVLVHIHDVFLPYEYPREWVVEKGWGWTEQYLLQALLTFDSTFQVLWAGHFLQREFPDFARHFPHSAGRTAQSLWLRKRAE